MQDWGFYMPTQIRFGWGRFNEIRQVVDELNGKRAFLVTGKDFPKQSDAVERALQILGPWRSRRSVRASRICAALSVEPAPSV
jgi:alcohol dehydrogenase class IV